MKRYTDEQGKLFGIINPVDLVVILVVLALGIKVLSDYRPVPLQTEKHPIRLGVIVRNVPPYFAESLAVGQDVFDHRTHAYLGKIMAISTQPAEVLLTGDGKMVRVKSPSHQDVRLELGRNAEILTSSSKYGVYFGKLIIRVGETVDAYTLYTRIRGEVEYLRKKR